ncbi:TetR/AcrR family transcriptional regulator [Pectobacterium aroidearum]|uniref:TetR/AcrR family transcriptional regulator n=1 Tax=Pectobacterium aroidearum TaxID=1201031 RepID=UPI003158691D
MGKRKIIDRNKLLDTAENIIDNKGASALTIENVAKEMGISKGGVQSCFGNKSGLINALLDRWGKRYDGCLNELNNEFIEISDPITLIKKHVRITLNEQELLARAASHLIVTLEAKEQREWLKRWHAERLKNIDTATIQGKKARLAYFATEGAFVLRYFGLYEMTSEEWKELFTDIEDLFES